MFKHMVWAVALGACSLLPLAHAQTSAASYPSKPIKIIVPFPAGGTSDVLARLIGQKMSDAWGQAVVVENRAGSSGNVGADALAKSAPDGYTLALMDVGNLAISPSLYKLPFQVPNDFAPITMVAYSPHLLVVPSKLPVNNVAELVAYAKANPDKLNYGSSGNGSPQQLASEMLNHAAGIQMQHVPYKGAVPAITDLLGGRIQVFIGAVNSLLPHIKEGKLRLIAGAGGKRFAAFPDVPAIAETVPGVALDVWLGVFMPAGVPKDMVAKVNTDIARVLQLPDVKANLSGQGIEPAPSSPEALAATIKDDYARWGKVIREANIKAD